MYPTKNDVHRILAVFIVKKRIPYLINSGARIPIEGVCRWQINVCKLKLIYIITYVRRAKMTQQWHLNYSKYGNTVALLSILSSRILTNSLHMGQNFNASMFMP